MARKKLSMRKLSEVLRLGLEAKVSVRMIASSCCLARSTVSDYLCRARLAGVGWPLPEGLSEEGLDRLLFPVKDVVGNRPKLDMVSIRHEMRGKNVTLQLLWEEYRTSNPDGYSYSQYCQLYRDWLGKQSISLRQEHRAGEKLFVDYAGDKIPITDPVTGLVSQGHLFVAVLGCSNYTYAEVTATEQLPDWIGAHVNALEDINGVPLAVVPDNTKAAVRSPCWYDPDVNLTYLDLAECYGFMVLPARVRKPKDKAKVENGVLIAERWILARLRHHTFFSLSEANKAVRQLLVWMNAKPFKKLPGCRKSVLEEMERPALKPLPARRYEFAEWKEVGVNIDYHVEVDDHYYSVPYRLIKQRVMARFTRSGVEMFQHSKRIATHARSYQKGKHTTLMEHRPPAHAKYLAWTPERLCSWAATIGENCAKVVTQVLESRPLVEHGYRSCLGIIRLAKRYGNERLERACKKAIRLNIVSYHRIENMLRNGRDKIPVQDIAMKPAVASHDNLRGPEYFQ